MSESRRSTENPATLSVARNTIDVRIDESLARLYELAEEEWFEDGLQSNLGLGLDELLQHHPAETMSGLKRLLKKSSVRQPALVETLKVLGRVESPETREPRLYTLVDFLSHSSMVVRDAALVGLCLLDDERALPYLARAAEHHDDDSFFKRDLKDAMKQIRAPRGDSYP